MGAHRVFFLCSLTLLLGCSRTHLPIIQVPATEPGHTYVAILLSGDGGWARIDKEISSRLADRGIPTLGLSSLRYFWFQRTQSEIGKTLIQILAEAERLWPDRKFILIGFSRGANVLPFMMEGLPPDMRQRIVRIALLSPTPTTEFVFHISDWWNESSSDRAKPLLPALESLHGIQLVCLYGTQDISALCPQLPAQLARIVAFPGGHHVHDDYSEVTRAILEGLPDAHSSVPSIPPTTNSSHNGP